MLARETSLRISETTLLIVDDDKDDQLLLGLAFSELMPCLAIHFAENGQEALDYLRRCVTQPQLIVTDMHMPLVDGVEFVGCLRDQTQTKQVPVVVLSSLSNERDQQRCYQAGANQYLAKPRSYSDELKLAGQLIQAWLPPGSGPQGNKLSMLDCPSEL